jgi:RND superfamily putative drug exporter
MLLRRLGRACACHPWQTLGGWLGFAVLATVLAGFFGGAYTNGGTLPGTPAQAGAAFLARHFPALSDESALVAVHTSRGTLTGPPGAQGLAAVVAATRRLPLVAGVSVNLSTDRRTALLQVRYDRPRFDVPAVALTRLTAASRAGDRYRVAGAVTGNLVYDLSGAQTGLAEEIGIGIALLVLIAGFGSVVAALMPLVTAAFSLTVGLALVKLLATGYPVNSSAPSLATMIGLGVGIDYALFIVTRHRESLTAGTPVVDAAASANATAGSSVVYAGVTVIAAIAGLRFAGIPLITSLGAAAALVVAVAVIAAITLLPALLAVAGSHINAVRLYHLPVVHRGPPLDPELSAPAPSWWWRWARHVERRPRRYVVSSALVLLLLAAPLAAIRLGETDGGSAAAGSDEHRAYEFVSRGFGVGVLEPFIVGLQAPPGQRVTAEALRLARAAIASAGDVAGIGPVQLDHGADAAVLSVYAASPPAAQVTVRLANRLQSRVMPRVARLTGDRTYLTGREPGAVQLSAQVANRLPDFVGAVLALSFLLLMFVFRSLLVPLKAVVMNLLSIAAAYGVAVAVFQWGWLRDLVGLAEPVPIVNVVPMFMFAIVFGLSMDYEVFLLSRVREEWTHTRDGRGSVVMGLTQTGRVITSAALIMVTIFLSFMTSPTVVVKMMGFGLAVAVLVDASIIRLVLVPATMALLGDLNWWLPRWLDRILPHIELEGAVPITPALDAMLDEQPQQEGVAG